MVSHTDKMRTTQDSKKYIFLGNEEFGLPVLTGLLSKYPDRFSSIFTSLALENIYRDLASKHNIPLHAIKHINDNYKEISDYNPLALIVCGWSQLINAQFLDSFPCIGMHPTLLPKRRGRCPITWTLIDGLEESGVTIFHLNEGVDDGDVIFQRKFSIESNDNSMSLISKVNALLIKMFSDLIENFPDVPREKQDEKEATYKRLRTEVDDEIDLTLSSEEIDRFVRAHSPPYPLAYIRNNSGDKIYIKEVIIDK